MLFRRGDLRPPASVCDDLPPLKPAVKPFFPLGDNSLTAIRRRAFTPRAIRVEVSRQDAAPDGGSRRDAVHAGGGGMSVAA